MKNIKELVLMYPNYDRFKFRKTAVIKGIDLTIKHVLKLIDEDIKEFEYRDRKENVLTYAKELKARIKGK